MSYKIFPAALRECETTPFHRTKGDFVHPKKRPSCLDRIPNDKMNYMVAYEQAGLFVEPCEENSPYMAGYAIFWEEYRHKIVIQGGARTRIEDNVFEVQSIIAPTPQDLDERLATLKMKDAVKVWFYPEDIHTIIQMRPDRQQIYAKLAKGGSRNLTQKVSNRLWGDHRLRAAFRTIVEEELDTLMGIPPQANIEVLEMHFDGPEGKGVVQFERGGYGPYIKVNGRLIALVDLFYLSEMGESEDGSPGFPQICAYPQTEGSEAVAKVRFHDDRVIVLVDSNPDVQREPQNAGELWRLSVKNEGE